VVLNVQQMARQIDQLAVVDGFLLAWAGFAWAAPLPLETPLVPVGICMIFPPDLRKAAVCSSINMRSLRFEFIFFLDASVFLGDLAIAIYLGRLGVVLYMIYGRTSHIHRLTR
jgi:hypothetical protein